MVFDDVVARREHNLDQNMEICQSEMPIHKQEQARTNIWVQAPENRRDRAEQHTARLRICVYMHSFGGRFELCNYE